MNCSEFERCLEGLVELRQGTLSPAAERHRSSCAACAALWLEHQRLDVAVKAWRSDVPTIDLTSRVLAELQPQSVPAPARYRRTVAFAVGLVSVVAASLVLVVGPVWRAAPPVVAVAPDVTPPGRDGEGVDLTESMAGLWNEMKVSTPVLPERVLPKLPHVEGLWTVVASQEELPAEAAPTPPATTSDRIPLSSVVRDRVTSAFGFLGQTLPAQPQG
jgi:hypothetical protein